MIGSWMISRTGGPALYIEEIVSDRVVGCSWMDPMGQRQTGEFALDSLEQLGGWPDASGPIGLVSRPKSSPLDPLGRLRARLRAAAFGPLTTR